MRWILILALVALVVSVGIDLALHEGEGHFFWSSIYGFFALFGLFGCAAIILVSKWLGHRWLQRREEYYDSRNDGDD